MLQYNPKELELNCMQTILHKLRREQNYINRFEQDRKCFAVAYK